MNCSRYLDIQLRADSGIQIKFRLYSVLRQVQNAKLSYRRLKIIVFQRKLSYTYFYIYSALISRKTNKTKNSYHLKMTCERSVWIFCFNIVFVESQYGERSEPKILKISHYFQHFVGKSHVFLLILPNG